MKRIALLGVGISVIDIPLACATIAGWIARGERHYVCVTGVHGLVACQSEPALRAIHNRAGMVTPDGMPLVWFGWLSGRRGMARVYGPDLMLALCTGTWPGAAWAEAPQSWRHYFYGSTDDTLA